MYKMFASLILSGLLCLAGHATAQETMNESDDGTTESSVVDESANLEEAETERAPIASTKFTCTYGELRRLVEVAYDIPGQLVPCSVLYNKETESPGDIKTLWNAENEAGYCEDKAANFVDKLEELGWTCKAGG